MSKNYSIIQTVIPKESLVNVINKPLKRLCESIFVIKARGTLIKDEWYQMILPAMQPEQEILQCIVHKDNVNEVSNHIIKNAELEKYGKGSLFVLPCNSADVGKVISTKTKSLVDLISSKSATLLMTPSMLFKYLPYSIPAISYRIIFCSFVGIKKLLK